MLRKIRPSKRRMGRLIFLAGRETKRKSIGCLERNRLVNEYLESKEWKPESLTCSKYVKAKLKKKLVLLDEPENSLSATWQKELAQFLSGTIRAFNCQLIIATHSSFLLAIPGAKIYNLDTESISICRWNELENVRAYYDFFKAHQELFE